MHHYIYDNECNELIKQGLSTAEISRKTGLCRSAVQRRRRNLLGKTLPTPPRYDWVAIQSYYDEGHSRAECMKKFGFTQRAWTLAQHTGRFKQDPKRMHKKRDNVNLVGRRFGLLTVIERDVKESKPGEAHWKCLCDCGKEISPSIGNLNKGATRSCGCLRARRGPDSPLWTGCGDISGGFWDNVRSNAERKRGRVIPFEISIEYAWDLLNKQGHKCAISGVPISVKGDDTLFRTASLDRIDSSLGYIIGNVQWVHKDVNLMKLDHSIDEFLAWINVIYQFQKRETGKISQLIS